MTIQQFIEKAMEGGWKVHLREEGYQLKLSLNDIFLDPEAWKAVGKVEGEKWNGGLEHKRGDHSDDPADTARCYCQVRSWKSRMSGMVDALISGKTIEQYLETL